MRYLFALLLIANVVALGYFGFVDKGDQSDATLVVAQASLSQPVNFVNKTAEIPPEIGQK